MSHFRAAINSRVLRKQILCPRLPNPPGAATPQLFSSHRFEADGLRPAQASSGENFRHREGAVLQLFHLLSGVGLALGLAAASDHVQVAGRNGLQDPRQADHEDHRGHQHFHHGQAKRVRPCAYAALLTTSGGVRAEEADAKLRLVAGDGYGGVAVADALDGGDAGPGAWQPQGARLVGGGQEIGRRVRFRAGRAQPAPSSARETLPRRYAG